MLIFFSCSKDRRNRRKKAKYFNNFKGATILAGVVLAGIGVVKFRGGIAKGLRNVADMISDNALEIKRKPNLSEENVNTATMKKMNFDVDKRDKEVFESESLKERLAEKFPRLTDMVVDTVERQAERVKHLLNPMDKRMPFEDKRMFLSHEAEMVSSYLENDVLNDLLKLGKIKPENNIELRTVKHLIDDAKPLGGETVVYRTILTQHNGKTFDVKQQLRVGNVVEEKGFVSTSRDAAQAVRRMGEQNGFVARIKLQPGTKGIDCRRFTMLDLDTGDNATYILDGLKFRINSVDDRYKIIDAENIL